MRKFLHRVLPHHDTVVNSRWLKPFARWLAEPNLWHLHRRSVAGGVAIGLFCGLIPGPLQMIGAALFAVLLRVNLPVALFVTLYTNPFTIVPLYLLAYRLGAQATGGNGLSNLPYPELQWQNMGGELWVWLLQMGQPLLIGLPLLAAGLALIGYVAVRLAWRGGVLLKWRARRRKRG
ncbi:MAG TPA: DUF2062 domain-containing protein [Gallionella sp.]|nr:DUF2062 domain-containing protein [Gallionella sp.]OGS67505.1 MAG: hypothetical protein A2Z87_04875 [Gallionellales bacterium GWA2_54_124]HCI52335.1 DUF2062 domain-containing protein [Gallionella sp.]